MAFYFEGLVSGPPECLPPVGDLRDIEAVLLPPLAVAQASRPAALVLPAVTRPSPRRNLVLQRELVHFPLLAGSASQLHLADPRRVSRGGGARSSLGTATATSSSSSAASRGASQQSPRPPARALLESGGAGAAASASPRRKGSRGSGRGREPRNYSAYTIHRKGGSAGGDAAAAGAAGARSRGLIDDDAADDDGGFEPVEDSELGDVAQHVVLSLLGGSSNGLAFRAPAVSRLLMVGVTGDAAEAALRSFADCECDVSMRLVEPSARYRVELTQISGEHPSGRSQPHAAQRATRAVRARLVAGLVERVLGLGDPSHGAAVVQRIVQQQLPVVVSPPERLFKAQALELVERLRDLGADASIVLEDTGASSGSGTLSAASSSLSLTPERSPSLNQPQSGGSGAAAAGSLFAVHLRAAAGSAASAAKLVALVRQTLPSPLALELFRPPNWQQQAHAWPSPSGPRRHIYLHEGRKSLGATSSGSFGSSAGGAGAGAYSEPPSPAAMSDGTPGSADSSAGPTRRSSSQRDGDDNDEFAYRLTQQRLEEIERMQMMLAEMDRPPPPRRTQSLVGALGVADPDGLSPSERQRLADEKARLAREFAEAAADSQRQDALELQKQQQAEKTAHSEDTSAAAAAAVVPAEPAPADAAAAAASAAAAAEAEQKAYEEQKRAEMEADEAKRRKQALAEYQEPLTALAVKADQQSSAAGRKRASVNLDESNASIAALIALNKPTVVRDESSASLVSQSVSNAGVSLPREQNSLNPLQLADLLKEATNRWEAKNRDLSVTKSILAPTFAQLAKIPVDKSSWHYAQMRTMLATVKGPLVDFKIDPVTGASFEELREMTPAQKLAREEKMRENIEMDDVYRRYLRPPRRDKRQRAVTLMSPSVIRKQEERLERAEKEFEEHKKQEQADAAAAATSGDSDAEEGSRAEKPGSGGDKAAAAKPGSESGSGSGSAAGKDKDKETPTSPKPVDKAKEKEMLGRGECPSCTFKFPLNSVACPMCGRRLQTGRISAHFLPAPPPEPQSPPSPRKKSLSPRKKRRSSATGVNSTGSSSGTSSGTSSGSFNAAPTVALPPSPSGPFSGGAAAAAGGSGDKPPALARSNSLIVKGSGENKEGDGPTSPKPTHTKRGSMPLPMRAPAPVGIRKLKRVDATRRVAQMGYLKAAEQIIYFVDLAISAEGLENPFLGLVKPHPYIEIHKSRQHILERVAVTDICYNSLDPIFSPLIVNVDTLCNMQLERPIILKCWTHSRMGDSRTLIGECVTSLAVIQSNIGGRFPLINPDKVGKVKGYKNSGHFRFNRAELCVNSTRAAVRFPGPNVANPERPIFDRLTECLTRIAIMATGCVTRSWGFLTKPADTSIHIHRKQPDGSWSQEPVHKTEIQFQNAEPSFYPVVIKLHTLCYGDIGRPILLKLMNYSKCMGQVVLSLKDMALSTKLNKPFPVVDPETGAAAESKSSCAIIFKKAQVYSHLSDLPLLAANAGVKRKAMFPPATVYEAEKEEESKSSGLGLGRVPSMSVAGAGAAAGASPGLSLDPDSKQSFDRGDGKRGNPSGNNYDDKGDAKGEGKRRVSVVGEEAGNEDELDEETKAALRNAHIHEVRRSVFEPLTSNDFRGTHHLRAKTTEKLLKGFQRISLPFWGERRLAFVMGAGERAGENSPLKEHLFGSPIFDRNALNLVWEFAGFTAAAERQQRGEGGSGPRRSIAAAAPAGT